MLYCTADRYGLDELKRLALRKQGLQSGIQCSTILASARYAYAHTPDTDSKLRAHYLALIIRSRATFKRSGNMQMEMEKGGMMFFDLFVAICNHMVRSDLISFFSPFQGLHIHTHKQQLTKRCRAGRYGQCEIPALHQIPTYASLKKAPRVRNLNLSDCAAQPLHIRLSAHDTL